MKLTDEQLKKVTGGAMGDLDIRDLVKDNTGKTCEELLVFFETLLNFAREDGKSKAANDLENILKTGTLNIFKAQALMGSLAELKEVAEKHNLTQELEYLNMISI